MILLDVAAAHAAAFDGEDRSARRRIDGNIEFADLDIVVAHEDGCLGLQCLSPSCHRVSLTAWRARSLRLRDPKSQESGPRRATELYERARRHCESIRRSDERRVGKEYVSTCK